MSLSNLNYTIDNLENDIVKLTITKENNGDDLNKITNNSRLIPFDMDKITILHLSNCNLSEIPKKFVLNNLIELDISRNQLKTVPNLVSANIRLKTLNISHNNLRKFDNKPKCASCLHNLDISYNLLEHIPPWTFNRYDNNLEILKLSNNPFNPYFQLTGRFLKYLKLLELNNGNLKFCTNSNSTYLVEMPRLEKLFLSNISSYYTNFIAELPFQHFACVEYLKELHLTGLHMLNFPEEITVFKSLEILNLHNNCITKFPDNFTLLINLLVLIVSQNQMLSLPSDIGKLKLRKLIIYDNFIDTLPVSIIELKSLELFDCYNNDFTEEIIKIVNKLPSLIAVDYDQNTFEVTEDEVYLKKRENLREENDLNYRLTGPRLMKENTDSEKSSSSLKSNDYFDYEPYQTEQEENWDLDWISDDMELILPPFKFEYKSVPVYKDPRDSIDPVSFEDVSDSSFD